MDNKQTLVIGSTVVDVLLSVPVIPRRGDDVNIISSECRLGGCAYNVYKTLKLMDSPALLCSPLGKGLYGSIAKQLLEKEGLKPFVSLETENGCCYCLVEPGGERSFLSHHGAEYLFSRSWMDELDFSRAGSVFICGLEVEDKDGEEIIDFVFEKPDLELYFAPGPRIAKIQTERMERLLGRRDSKGNGPFLHLNELETFQYSGKDSLEDGAKFLQAKTGNSLVITLGEKGCYYLSDKGSGYVPPFPARVLDTVGAGDAHCGPIIACLKKGMNLEEACKKANRIGAAVTEIQCSVLDRLPPNL